MTSFYDIYGTTVVPIPPGFVGTEVRMPEVGEFFVSQYPDYRDRRVAGQCTSPWRPEHGPRLILKRDYAPTSSDRVGYIPFSVRHGYEAPPPETIRGVYGTEVTARHIPSGFIPCGFRIPEKGVYFLPTTSVFAGIPDATQSSGLVKGPRIILKKVPTVTEVYGGVVFAPPGYELMGFRQLRAGDYWISSTSRRIMGPFRPVGADTPSYRMVVKKAEPKVPTIEEVYPRGIRIPSGYIAAGFRELRKGDLWLNSIITGTVTGPFQQESGEHRIILKKLLPATQIPIIDALGLNPPKPKEKTIRVVRVLEYVGPESWINNTLDKSAVKPTGLGMVGGSYLSPGRDQRIRELSIHKEEVK